MVVGIENTAVSHLQGPEFHQELRCRLCGLCMCSNSLSFPSTPINQRYVARFINHQEVSGTRAKTVNGHAYERIKCQRYKNIWGKCVVRLLPWELAWTGWN